MIETLTDVGARGYKWGYLGKLSLDPFDNHHRPVTDNMIGNREPQFHRTAVDRYDALHGRPQLFKDWPCLIKTGCRKNHQKAVVVPTPGRIGLPDAVGNRPRSRLQQIAAQCGISRSYVSRRS